MRRRLFVHAGWLAACVVTCLAAACEVPPTEALAPAGLRLRLSQVQVLLLLALVPAVVGGTAGTGRQRLHAAALECVVLGALALPFNALAADLAALAGREWFLCAGVAPLAGIAAAGFLLALPPLTTARYLGLLALAAGAPAIDLALVVAGASGPGPVRYASPAAWVADAATARVALVCAAALASLAYLLLLRARAAPAAAAAAILALVVGAGPAATAEAQVEPATASVRAAGFGGWFRRGEWTPLRIDVRAGGAPLSGRIRIGGEGEWTFEREVQIPARGRARVDLALLPLHDVAALWVEFPGQGRVALETGLSPLGPTEHLVGVEPDLLRAWTAAASLPPGTRAFEASAERMPDTGAAWESVDVLLVRDLRSWVRQESDPELRQRVVAAAEAWRALGGSCVEIPAGAPTPDQAARARPHRPHGCILPGIESVFERPQWSPNLRRGTLRSVAAAATVLLAAVLFFSACRRRGLALLPAAIALVFAASAPPGRFLGERRASVQSGAWLEEAGGGRPAVEHLVAQVTQPAAGPLEAPLPGGPWRPLFPTLEQASAARLVLCSDADGTTIRCDLGAAAALRAEAVKVRPPETLPLSVVRAGDRWAVRAAGVPVQATALLCDRQVFPLGDLPAGGSARVLPAETPAGELELPRGAARLLGIARGQLAAGTWALGWLEPAGPDPLATVPYLDSTRSLDLILVAP